MILGEVYSEPRTSTIGRCLVGAGSEENGGCTRGEAMG